MNQVEVMKQEPLVNIELSRRMAAVKVNNFYGSIIKDAEKEIERLHGLVLQHVSLPQQEKQEPVGQLQEEAYGRGQVLWFSKPADLSMLYTTPPAAQRQPLTNEMLWEMWVESPSDVLQFARDIERAHGIGGKE